MAPDRDVYCRKTYRRNSSLMVTIPIPLAKRLGIVSGQLMKITERDGALVYEPSDLSPKAGRPRPERPDKAPKAPKDTEPDTPVQATRSKAGGKHKVDLDDPDFNPISRLAL